MATVLLVEDDPATRLGLELALRRLGYGVRPAGTDPDQFLARTLAEEPAARERADTLVASALLLATGPSRP